MRVWTRAGRTTWGVSLEYPVTIWDVAGSKKVREITGIISTVRLDASETILMMRHVNGQFELRDSIGGHKIFTTNAELLSIKRAFPMERPKFVALLAGPADPNRSREADGAQNGTMLVSHVFFSEIAPNEEPRITEAKRAATRCLTLAEMRANLLRAEPPAWCINMEKWPYQGAEWKQWLSDKRAGRNPKMPMSAELNVTAFTTLANSAR